MVGGAMIPSLIRLASVLKSASVGCAAEQQGNTIKHSEFDGVLKEVVDQYQALNLTGVFG